MLSRSVLPRRTLRMLEQYSIVGRAVLVKALSLSFLEQISVSEALKFRDANTEALERFRTKVADLSHELDEADPGSDLNNRLVRILDQAVVPEMQILADRLKESRRRIFGNLLSGVATTAVPASAAASLYAASSGPALLALGVGAGAAAFGVSIASVVERWQEHKKLDKDWLAFCVGLRGIAEH
jgi:hypothetical protein